jgi:hypothetical protein
LLFHLKKKSMRMRFPKFQIFNVFALLAMKVLICALHTVHAQTWQEEKRIELGCQNFQVDALENMYFLCDDYVEVMRHQDGKKFRTSFLEYGPNYQLDVTNPLNPFLFYPDQGIALFLDNMLSFQGETIRWQEMGFEQIEWMAGSRGDHFWLWDGAANELLRVNRQFQIQQRTGDLSSRLGKQLRPIQILEGLEDVCLVTEMGEVVVLDLFGAYRSIFQITQGGHLLGFSDSVVAWQVEEEIHALDLATWAEEVTKGLPKACHFMRWQNSRWYAKCDGYVVKYSLRAT